MLVTLDIAALCAIVLQRLAADSDGAPVRAKLGLSNGGGTRPPTVLHAESLDKALLPARPFVALRAGPVPVVDRVIYQAFYTWWVYDDLQQGYRRIDSLIPLIGTAYQRQLDSPGNGAPSWIDMTVGQQTRDPALGLLVRPIQLTIYL